MTTNRWKSNLGRTLGLAILALSLCTSAYGAPKYKILHNFGATDGTGPWRGVSLDAKGNLFGTAVDGGTGNCRYGCGTVFQLTPQAGGKWAFAVLYDFTGGSDGATPYGGVILGASGGLYGTTSTGGAHNEGTAYELLPGADGGWTLGTLYAFCPKVGKSGCTDHGGTEAPLVFDHKGNLYGTKQGGGTDGGEIYQLTPNSDGWSEKILHTFRASYYNQPAPGGSNPYAGLILDAAGNLYGTAEKGGKGGGVIFELIPTPTGGWKELVLHKFANDGKDGLIPGWGALIMDGSGSLYGTTVQGGANICYAGCGTVFRLTKSGTGRWKEAILYNFRSGSTGFSPNAGVVMDNAGNLYGTTDYGGSGAGCGVIYKLAAKPKGKWAYTVLHAFSGYDGCLPEGNLVLDKKGNLYGGTVLGGTSGNGVIFELTP